MGSSLGVEGVVISKNQFLEICATYSKTYLTVDEAHAFLHELCDTAELDWDEDLAAFLIETCDEDKDGYLTLKEFQKLFFKSAEKLNVSLTKSLEAEKNVIMANFLANSRRAAAQEKANLESLSPEEGIPEEPEPIETKTEETPQLLPLPPSPAPAAEEAPMAPAGGMTRGGPPPAPGVAHVVKPKPSLRQANHPEAPTAQPLKPRPTGGGSSASAPSRPPGQSYGRGPPKAVKPLEPHEMIKRGGGPPPPKPVGPASNQYYKQKPKEGWKIDDGDRTKWNFDPKKSYKAKAVTDDIDWESCLGFTRSEGGSEGVFFLGFGDGNEILVLKGSSSVFADSFATEIGILCGMPITNLKTINFGHPDFLRIIKVLNELDKLHPQAIRGRHHTIVRVPVIEVMTFVPGSDLKGANPASCLPLEKKEVLFRRLFDIGRIQAYDIFLNNWDRVPTLWDTNGNIANLFYATNEDDPRIVGIDQQTNAIPESTENWDLYIRDVTRWVTEVADFDLSDCGNRKFRHVAKIRPYLRDQFETDIGTPGLEFCWLGMMVGIVSVVETINEKLLKEMHDKMIQNVRSVKKALVQTAQELMLDYGLHLISAPFLSALLAIYRQAVPKIKERLKGSAHQERLARQPSFVKLSL